MKVFFRVTLALIATTLMVASCASSDNIDRAIQEQASLDAWMKLHINNNSEVATRLDNGMYIEWLSGPGAGVKPEVGQWIEINYNGITIAEPLRQKYFMTRNEQLAERLGTFTVYTHYVPHYMLFNSSRMTEGQYIALNQMGVGDQVRLYMPSALSLGIGLMTYSNGHGGEASVPTGSPMIVEMELVNIVDDPSIYEEDQVRELAMKPIAEGGFNKAEFDTIRPHLYLDVFEYETDPTKLDTVRVDSTARLYYVGSFLDGFVFDTNVDSIGAELKRDTSKYAVLSYRPSSKNNKSLIDAFYEVFAAKKITYNSKFRMVFISEYGYTNVGNPEGTVPYTIIQPYTPLIFEVTVLPKKDPEVEE